jgi:hypothetical protein
MEQRICEEFGDHVAGIVMGCSDAVAVPGQPKPPWRDRKAAYLDRLAGEDDPDVLLVSACDKLHNARAIIADLRAIGSALWDRFTQADPAAQLWYYQGSGTKRGRLPQLCPALSDAAGLEQRRAALIRLRHQAASGPPARRRAATGNRPAGEQSKFWRQRSGQGFWTIAGERQSNSGRSRPGQGHPPGRAGGWPWVRH